MASHIKILGVLNIVLGALGIAIGLGVMLLLGGIGAVVGAADRSGDGIIALPILGGIGFFIFAIVLVLSVPGIIAGIGLLKFRPWARVLAIVMSALNLLNVPFGTAIGVYGLWVLLSVEGQRLFEERPAGI